MSALVASVQADAGALELDAELTVAAGETVAVLGPNGAGKTTLVRVLAGLHPLASGEIRLDEQVLASSDPPRWLPPEGRSVGVVFQDLRLFEHLDLLDNVAFGLRARGARRAEARRQAGDWLERVGLLARATDRPTALSGGQAQLVALARALAPSPTLLLLDEPLSSLDVTVRAGVRRTLGEHLAAHAGPRLLVTHDPLDAAILADRVLVLEHGRVTADGLLADLVARPRTAWIAELVGTNLLPARAIGARLVLEAGGALLAAEAPKESSVLVAVRPAAVALHRGRPEGSPRNVWRAVVVEIDDVGDRVRVRLGGGIPLVAEVTGAAMAELELAVGREVWASVKATEVEAYPA